MTDVHSLYPVLNVISKHLTAAEQTTVLMMGLALGSRPLKRLSAHSGQKLKPYIVYPAPREAPILQTQ